VLTWRAERVGGGAPRAGGGIFRFTGTARDGDEALEWSVVLKVTVAGAHRRRTQGDASDPRNMHYAPRERLAFTSGLLADLPGIAAPRCFGAAELPDDVLLRVVVGFPCSLGPDPSPSAA
jgi:hypothetical protein